MSNKLFFLKQLYSHAPKQRTPEWFQVRDLRIGSSQLKKIPREIKKMEENKEITKHEPNDFEKRMFQWGHLCEAMIKEYLSCCNFPEIHEFGSISCSQFPIAFSPDGIFVFEEKLILLEIKSSFNQDNFKPDQYLDQIQCGLYVSCCDYAVLVWNQIRICKYYQLSQKGTFCQSFHKPRSPFTGHTDLKEIFIGYFYWGGETSSERPKEQFECKDHSLFRVFKVVDDLSKAVTSLNEEVMKLRGGSILFVKCFKIEVVQVQKDPLWYKKLEREIDVWKHYSLKHQLI